MKHIFILISSLLPVFTSGSQTNCTIKKAWAFYTVSIPGMQMTDSNGNPVPPKAAITRFIYVECAGAKNPEIETVLYNGKALSATLTPVAGNSIIPGSDIGNNIDFKITVKKTNSLWKIELQPLPGNEMPEQDCKNIIIKNKRSGITCEFKLVKEKELTAMPRY